MQLFTLYSYRSVCVCVLQVRDDYDERDSLCAAASVLLQFHLTGSGGLSVPQINKDLSNPGLLFYFIQFYTLTAEV